MIKIAGAPDSSDMSRSRQLTRQQLQFPHDALSRILWIEWIWMAEQVLLLIKSLAWDFNKNFKRTQTPRIRVWWGKQGNQWQFKFTRSFMSKALPSTYIIHRTFNGKIRTCTDFTWFHYIISNEVVSKVCSGWPNREVPLGVVILKSKQISSKLMQYNAAEDYAPLQ